MGTTIGENVKKRRKAAGLTQERLARATDMSLRVVTSLEQGEVTDPRASTLMALAKALGCGVDDLLKGTADSLRKGGKDR